MNQLSTYVNSIMGGDSDPLYQLYLPLNDYLPIVKLFDKVYLNPIY
jgi:hypothetical protein